MLPPNNKSPGKQSDGIVPTEHEIWIVANRLINQHGDDAALKAATRADKLAVLGDTGGYALWKRIVRAIVDPRRTEQNGTTH
jgi:hypothetical protein